MQVLRRWVTQSATGLFSYRFRSRMPVWPGHKAKLLACILKGYYFNLGCEVIESPEYWSFHKY